ncbi:MAG TPA: putative Ig domain-containing protein, partial [Burkholderiales bacterium]|nr:putative Ig domain-containing protein [Burkholderiales bacterium]
TLIDWYIAPQRRIDEVFFEVDGVSWDAAMLEQLAPVGGGNSAPELVQPMGDQVADEDMPFGFIVPAGTFDDADALTYEADFASGWLSFDPHSRTFSGTPTNDDVGIVEVTVTATDPFGEGASDTFRVLVRNVNDAPVVSLALDSQSATEGQALAYVIPAGTFSDVDAGDQLSLSAELADGSGLPGWLQLDGGQITAAPGMSDGGEYQLRVIATDSAGARADATLNLTVQDSLATGNFLIGTPADDVLNGTGAAEVLSGRGGIDRLLGGGGDDMLLLSPDERVRGQNKSRDWFDGGGGFDTLFGTTGHDVLNLDAAGRLAGIEYIAMRGGHDHVDLRSAGISYGDVILDGGVGHDVLRTSDGDDVLLGRSGNDELSGGAGWDLYVHEILGGHDRIRESGVEGEIDVLRFGDGITRDMVRARRQGGDLQLHLSGANGSVTVEDWFSRKADRVELVQFADGFAWDEDDIAQLARRSRFGDGDRLGREGGADAMEIARQWAAVQRHADALALGEDDLDEGGDWQPVSMGASVDARRRRSAFEAAQATEGFRSLEAQ